MRLAAITLLLVLAAACSKKRPPGPPPRCVVKVQLPKTDADPTKAPACSVAILAPDTTSFADVVAAMDTLAKAGFTDFGIGDVVSHLPPPPGPTTATRTTNEGLLIGRIDLALSAPIIVLQQTGDVMVAGAVIGKTTDSNLTDEIAATLAKPALSPAGSAGSAAPAAAPTVIISAHASVTYGAIYRAAKAADKLGYASILFSMKAQ
jgi:biopolymer transport protein ExbD